MVLIMLLIMLIIMLVMMLQIMLITIMLIIKLLLIILLIIIIILLMLLLLLLINKLWCPSRSWSTSAIMGIQSDVVSTGNQISTQFRYGGIGLDDLQQILQIRKKNNAKPIPLLMIAIVVVAMMMVCMPREELVLELLLKLLPFL